MKKYLLGLFLTLMMVFGSASADAQTSLTGTQGYSWPAITNATPTGVFGNTIQFIDLPPASTQVVSWLVTGTAPSVCTFRVEGSFNGYAWFQLDKDAPTSDSCLTSSSTSITNQLVNYIRINILTYTPAMSTNIALTYAASVTNINLPQANNFLLSIPGMSDDGALGFNLTGTGHVTQLIVASDPTTAMQVADKEYVDTQVSSISTGGAGTAVPLSGGTMTGSLQLNANPTTALQAATKQYVDASTGAALPLAGGTVTGPIVLPANPTLSLQAATKSYVDTQVAGVVVGSGGLPTTGGTMTGALTLAADPTTSLQASTKHYVDASIATVGASPLAGTLSANSEATTSSNGIGLSLTACLSEAYVCSIVAPALYATTEAQPWGSRYNPTSGTITQTIGPKSTDPIGAFEDLRYGPPQWVMNQTVASPMFHMINTAASNTYYGGGPAALTLVQTYLSGARDSYIDETPQTLQTGLLQSNTPGNRYGDQSTLNCFAPGDCQAHINRPYSTGVIAAQSEGVTSFRGHQGETSTVQQGSLTTSPTCTTTGCVFALTQTQGTAGGWASWLPLIDISAGFSTGYIASINGNSFTGSTAANWYGTYGATAGNTTSTVLVDNAYNGSSSTTNTFPYNGEVIPVASVAGFTSGNVACIFSNSDRKWETANITAVGGSSITVGRLDFPLTVGSTITSGGLCGYGFTMDVNNFIPSAPNGVGAPTDQTPTVTIRQVWPIMSNTSGNVLTVYAQGARSPGGRAPQLMSGSGGTASVTISGGAATACTATGGTSYLWGAVGEQAPQLVITGISSTVAPVLAVSAVSGGALNGCTVETPGSGITGTAAVTVTPYNPYHIWPQALVMDALNHTTGAVDGSSLTTAPVVGTVTSGDTMELSHYFAFLDTPINLASFQVQATYARNNLVSSVGGAFSGFDAETTFINYNALTMYSGLPLGLATPWVYGNATSYAPSGHQIQGPHANGLFMNLPPFGGQYGNNTGALFVACGTASQCSHWNATYPVIGVANATNFYAGQAYDIVGYNPYNDNWTLTSGAAQFDGYGATNKLVVTPTGESFAQPLSLSNPNTVSDNTGTSVQSAWLSVQGSGQTNGTYQAYDATGGAIVSYVVSGNVVTAVRIAAKGNGYQIAPTFTTSGAGGTPGIISTSLSSPFFGLASWGDSLTDGGGGYGNTPIPYLVQSYTGLIDEDAGAWGQLATQIAVRTGAMTTTMTPSGGTISACASLPCGTATTVTFTTNYEPINSYGPSAGVSGTCTSGATSAHGFVLYNGSTYSFTPTSVISATSISNCAFQADVYDYGFVPIIWAGRNDVTLSTSIPNAEAAIAAMTANKPSTLPALVLGVLTQTTETTGTTNWTTIAAMNSTLASTYGNCTTPSTVGCGFLSPQAILIASANPSNVADWYDANTKKTRPLSYGMPTALATLAAGINNSVTSFTITVQANGTGYAYSGNTTGYWVIDTGANQEEVYCTATSGSGASYTVSTCTRNQNGSGAFAHASGVVANQVDTLHLGAYAQSIIAGQIAQWTSSHLTVVQDTGSQHVTEPTPKTVYASSIVFAAPQIAPSVGSPNNVYYAASPVVSLIQSTVTNMFAVQMSELDVNNLVLPTAAGGHFYWGGCNNYTNGGNISWGCPLVPTSYGGTYLGNASQPWQAIYLTNTGAGVKFSSVTGGCCNYEQLLPYSLSGAENGDVEQLAGSPGYVGLGIPLPGGTATCTPQTNYTCTVSSGYSLTNAFGKLVIVGNASASAGQAATLFFSATLPAAPKGCTFSEVGTTLHGVDATSAPGTSGFGISTSATMASQTMTFYYYCY